VEKAQERDLSLSKISGATSMSRRALIQLVERSRKPVYSVSHEIVVGGDFQQLVVVVLPQK